MRTFTILLITFLCFGYCHAANKTAGDYSFGVRITGKGKPMILIPGLKGSADTYNDVVAHYKDHYKCYVITLAGFAGQPASGVHDHLLLKQRDDIIRYIIDKQLDHPVLVGFSFGGILALWITTTRPDLIGPMIDLDGTPFDLSLGNDHYNKDSLIKANGIRYNKLIAQPTAYWKKRDSIFHAPHSIKQGDVYMKKLVSDTNRIAETLVWDIASDFRSAVLMDMEEDTIDMRNDMARVTSPILVLGSWVSWDYKSKADGEKDYRKAYDRARNVTIAFSDHGRHFLMWEDYDWMIGEMDKFLDKYR